LGAGPYLNTSIIQKAHDLPIGYYMYRLGGSDYTGNDLPLFNYAYGNAVIHKRNNISISVVLYGETEATPIATKGYNGTSWTGWQIYARKSDFSFLRINGSRGETFKAALSGKTDRITFIAFNNSPSDNPFSFSTGYALAMQDGMLTTPANFNLIGINRTDNAMECARLNIE
jgi:hypothetical protein